MRPFVPTNLRFLMRCVAVVLCSAALWSCARIGNPSGGPRDEDPPRFVSANPAPGSVNVHRQKMTLVFNEIVNVKDAFSNVVVSPTAARAPRVTAQGRKVNINFQDTLQPNTTYTLDFGNAIEDNNEGNKLNGFSYTFSTGPDIDTLQISGMVLDARTLEPQQGMLVGIHSMVDDTTFQRKRMERVAKTDDRGRFTVRGVKEGSYRVFALKDLNNDFRWDNPDEDMAFYDVEVLPTVERVETTDTIFNLKTGDVDSVATRIRSRYLPNDILLNSFNMGYKPQYLLKNERLDSTHISLVFNTRSDTLPEVSIVGRPDLENWYRLERSQHNDTLTYWITDPAIIATDTLRLATRYLRTDSAKLLTMQPDTLRLITQRPRAPKNNKQVKEAKHKKQEADSLKAPEIKFLGMRMLTTASHEVYNPLLLEFDTPLDTLVASAFHLEQMVDSVWQNLPPPKVEPADSVSIRQFKIEREWGYGEKYRLRVDSMAATGIYGLFTAPLTHEFAVKKMDDYSNLRLNVAGLPDTICSFVELLSSNDQPVRSAIVTGGIAEFRHLAPGTYYARLVADLNCNGEYDTGNYELGQQPELTFYYPKELKLKANWDVDQSWDVAEVPVNLQKPLAIKKNKSDEEKRAKAKKTDDEDLDEEDDNGVFDPNRNPFDPNDRGRNRNNTSNNRGSFGSQQRRF